MNKIINLDYKWYITYLNFQEKPKEDMMSEDIKNWIKATVPGDIHRDLCSAGVIPEPYFGINADLCRWVEEKDWYYKTIFNLPDIDKSKKIFLIFEGIDTFATIFLNGEKIAENKNMFTFIKVDITEKVCFDKKNILVVKISSPIFSVQIKDKNLSDWYLPRLYSRKAQFNYGWDIAPHLVSIGIWKPVYIKIVDNIEISDIYVKTNSWNAKTAFLKTDVEIKNYFNKDAEVNLILEVLDEKKEKIQEIEKKVIVKKLKKGRIKIPFKISPFKLWWPNGAGEQALYTAIISIKKGSEIIEKKEEEFGIRNIKLIQDKISKDESTFYFVINGKRIFIKGFNWTPADTFPGTIKPERYETLLRMIKETGANMLRVWGGGIYEDEIFYKLCSKLGILIWQDFMFACSKYPDDKEFLKEAEKEAVEVVKRLRRHTCLTIWSGGNENDSFGCGKSHKIGWQILKKVCKKLNPEIPYIPDSPYDPLGKDPNSNLRGDCHLWAHGKSYRDEFFLNGKSKFVSEIGHISVPNLETLLSFMPEDKLWPPFNKYWFYHASDTLRVGWKFRIQSLFDSIKNNNLPEPQNINEFIEFTQDLQAEAYKTFAEYFADLPNCGGILLWNVCDCWPQISDSIIDWYLRPKKVYYKVKEIFLKLKNE